MKRTAIPAFRYRVLVCTAAAVAVMCAMCVPSYAKTKITFMAWVTGKSDTDAFNRLAKEFMKDNTDIDVKVLDEPWTGDLPYFQKYITMTTGGVAPDAIMIPYTWVPNLAEGNIIEDLTPMIKRSKLDLSAYSAAGVAASSWKGKVWGLSGGTSSDWWVQYNKKIIDESGMVDPGVLSDSGNWNWDTMEAIMTKTSRFNGNKMQRVGLDQMGDACSVAPWIWGMGGQVLNADGSKALIDQQATIDAVTRLRDNILNKKIMGMAWTNYNLDISQSAKSNQFAMSAWWNTLATLWTSKQVTWPMDMVPFPKGPKSAMTNVTQIHNWCMSKQSKQKPATWRFLQFLGGAKGQTMLLDDLAALPTRHDVVKKLGEYYASENMPHAASMVEDAMSRQHIWDRSTKMYLALPILNDYFNRVWLGKSDPAVAMKDGAKAANLVLARAVRK